MEMGSRAAGIMALAGLLLGCGGDDAPPAASTTGTGTGASATEPTSTTAAASTSSGGVDSTSSTGSSSTAAASEGSSTTEPGIVDPGCPECLVLVEGLEGGRGLSLHGEFVYFTDQTAGTVQRVPKGGGEIEVLANLQSEPYDVVASDDHVFWTTFVVGGSVWRANLPSGPPIPLSSDGFPRMMQIVGDYVYWCAFDDVEGRVRRVLANGIGNPPETLVAVGNGVADLVVSGSEVYFTAHEPPLEPGLAPPGTVYRAAADVPTDVLDLELLAVDQSEPWGIAATADTIFWVNGLGSPDDQPKSLVSAPRVGGAAPTVLATDQVAPWGVTTDDQYVYWTDYSRVRAVPHAGGEPLVLAELQIIARSIAVDEDDVFWITRERVLQRPKP